MQIDSVQKALADPDNKDSKALIDKYSVTPNPKFCLLFGAKKIGTHKESEVMRWETQ